MHHHGHHGHHGGGLWNGQWGGYLPFNRFDSYSPVEFVQQTVSVPNWALYTGLGLLVLAAFGGRR